jgi:hypothetical protein
MLAPVLAVLVLIPFIAHSGPLPEQHTVQNRKCQYICTYITAIGTSRLAHIRPDLSTPGLLPNQRLGVRIELRAEALAGRRRAE